MRALRSAQLFLALLRSVSGLCCSPSPSFRVFHMSRCSASPSAVGPGSSLVCHLLLVSLCLDIPPGLSPVSLRPLWKSPKKEQFNKISLCLVCMCWLTSLHLCRWAQHSDSGLYRFIPHHQDQESAGPEDRPEAILLPVTKIWFLQPDIRTHHR